LARLTTRSSQQLRSDDSTLNSVAVALCALAASLCALTSATVARADGINISPTRITLAGNHNSGFVVVTNSGNRPELFQVTVVSWTQSNAADRYAATDALLAVPVVFAVDPGQSQTVRVASQVAFDSTKESTYRLFISELPTAARRPDTTLVLLRFSIPIFAPPQHVTGPHVVWSCSPMGNGRLRVSASNNGDEHAVISVVRLFADAGHKRQVASWNPAAYILSGQSRSWVVDETAKIDSAPLYVEVRSIDGTLSAIAPVKN
jgi:fimbrial chaperone protein